MKRSGEYILFEPNEPTAGTPRAAKSHKIALGIERIGLISLRYPIAVAIVAILLSVTAAIGITRLKIDDSLSQLFRSDSAAMSSPTCN